MTGHADRLVVLVNHDLRMSPGKLASQAVHAALRAFGVEHGTVVVLQSSAGRITADCDVVVRDAGLTEIPAGSVTAGVRRPDTTR